jgi:hypothetical protein
MNRLFNWRISVSHWLRAVLALALLALTLPAAAQEAAPPPQPAAPAASAPAKPVAEVPAAVTEAIAAAPAAPDAVTVGAFINDIQELDFRNHSYAVDLYVWFRWTNSELDPSKTMEFMNRYAPNEHARESTYTEPKKMPDGSLYGVIRNQGRFSTKFQLERYPFDRQILSVVMEDAEPTSVQFYVPDAKDVTINPNITLPGFRVGEARMRIANNTYPTTFGDLAMANPDSYSRVVLEVPVTRPLVALSVKTFVPILLIIACSALVYFVRPIYIDGRIGLGITALLTLVALQLTASASLPEVDYLMMIDKVYLASYAFILAALIRVVATSWVGGAGSAGEAAIAATDYRWAWTMIALYFALVGIIAAAALDVLPFVSMAGPA